MGEFDTIAPDETVISLTDEHIKKYLETLIRKEDEEYDPRRINEALTGLSFHSNIKDAGARIMTFCANVFERLEDIGYRNFKDENPKYTIKLLVDRIKPPALKTAMEERVKVETGLDKDVRKFIQRLKEDAKPCQAFGQKVGGSDRIPVYRTGRDPKANEKP